MMLGKIESSEIWSDSSYIALFTFGNWKKKPKKNSITSDEWGRLPGK